MSIVNKILKEGYGDSDKEKIKAAISEIASHCSAHPFERGSLVLGDVAIIQISFFDGALWISSVQSMEKRGGDKAMHLILSVADKHKVICRLSPEPFGTKQMNKTQLVAWYKRLGFKKVSMGEMERLPMTTLTEDVKTIDTNKTTEPLKDTDKIRVYHGFGGYAKSSAIKSIVYGLSGQERADRAYSYEWVNNPTGLFVTIDFKVAERQFAGSGVIIEFDTIVSNLEAPVWAGQDNFFVQGQYTSGFNSPEERTAEQLRKRKMYSEKDPEDYYGGDMKQRISKSDRPELAQSIFNNGEKQALFIGNLDPNNIKYVWFHEGRWEKNTTIGEWTRMTRQEFVKKIAKPYVDKVKKDKNYNDSVSKAEQKIFKPNDDFTIEKFNAILDKNGWGTAENFMEIYGDDQQMLNSYLYPKQIKQMQEYMKSNNITNKRRGY